MMLHENTRLAIVSPESFYTIHITQQNFGLPVRKTTKLLLLLKESHNVTLIMSSLSSDMLEKLLINSLNK